MLLALAAVSAALLALPAMATAAELHVEGATGKAFTGSGAGGAFTAKGEPTLFCTSTTVSGEFTSETTATANQQYAGCNMTVLGVRLPCNTVGAPSEVIQTLNVFHLITTDTTAKPGILMTPPFATLICGTGFSQRKLQAGGNGQIGTITSPACGASSATATGSTTATEGNPEDKLYTGTTYDLTVTTEGGSAVTAAVTGSVTMTFKDGIARKLVCT